MVDDSIQSQSSVEETAIRVVSRSAEEHNSIQVVDDGWNIYRRRKPHQGTTRWSRLDPANDDRLQWNYLMELDHQYDEPHPFFALLLELNAS